MSRPKRTPRPRTVERQRRAASEKLVRARNALLDLEPGGSEARPIEVATPAVIEPRARAILCPRCDEPFELVEHEAHAGEHGRLRRAELKCRSCGAERSLWFRISAPS
jgi:hypothetical protein